MIACEFFFERKTPYKIVVVRTYILNILTHWPPSWIGPSTKWYFNEILFTRVLTHDKMEYINICERLECHGLPILC